MGLFVGLIALSSYFRSQFFGGVEGITFPNLEEEIHNI